MTGLFLAAIGLPGVGKSTVCDELAKLSGIKVLHDPEESYWPSAVMQRDLYGHFGAVMWFRSIRVPLYYTAQAIKIAGQAVIVDSYYDKLFSYYMHKKGMEWLIAPSDPYYPVLSEIAELDREILPNADCIISFEIDYRDWLQCLSKRGRMLDSETEFVRSYDTQAYFIEAAETYAASVGARLIHFKQVYSSPSQAAKLLRVQLHSQGIRL